MKALIILSILSASFATPTTITAPPVSENVVSHEKDDLKDFLGHCLHKKDVSKCLKTRVIDVVDDIIQSNDPLSVNLFNLKMSLNKNPQFREADNIVDTSRAFEDVISHKLKNLLESRVIQVKLADETNEEIRSSVNEEGRKKKDGGGGKHHMMMTGEKLELRFIYLD